MSQRTVTAVEMERLPIADEHWFVKFVGHSFGSTYNNPFGRADVKMPVQIELDAMCSEHFEITTVGVRFESEADALLAYMRYRA